MDCYNKYQTKQLHAHTYTCTHNSWWLVLGWVTTKEYHPRLCINNVDFMARYKCNYINVTGTTLRCIGLLVYTTSNSYISPLPGEPRAMQADLEMSDVKTEYLTYLCLYCRHELLRWQVLVIFRQHVFQGVSQELQKLRGMHHTTSLIHLLQKTRSLCTPRSILYHYQAHYLFIYYDIQWCINPDS